MNVKVQNCVEAYRHAFQPIWNINDWKVIGYETLLRTYEYHPNINTSTIFSHAIKNGHLYELDTMLITKSVTKYVEVIGKTNKLLFINVFLVTIFDHKFEEFVKVLLNQNPSIEGKIVLEINHDKNQESVWSNPAFMKKIQFLKNHHIYVALDFMEYEQLNKLIELAPNYIKIKSHFSSNLAFSLKKQQEVKTIMDSADGNIQIILEGIEKETDLAMSKLLKIPYGQGNILGEPVYYY